MEKLKADELRKRFLEFFKSKGHTIVESDSLVPKQDPTLLFTGAGMNQFKQQFLGHNIRFKRAASCQKCLRTQDIENVGKTAGHHTFFEMLGNFSFGDYFKEDAIAWAWEFLRDALNIDSKRLWVSIYEEDVEAYGVWKDKLNLPVEKIVKLGDKENFWPSQVRKNGPNGPCGPCSEIFFDWGKQVGCKRPECSPGCDCGRFVEVWNLVFTQFDRKEGAVLEPLPSKNIDTGMGLERLAAVMQGKKTNFETDLFVPIIEEINRLVQSEKPKVPSYEANAIADHIRAITFAIYDGVIPSNEERGYVIRSLIRKAYLFGKSLGLEKPFLYRLVPIVINIMKQPYPQVTERRENISQIVKAEEERFINTYERGSLEFERLLEDLLQEKKSVVPGEEIFRFYDTYGFPLNAMQVAAAKRGMTLAKDVFEGLLTQQRQRSRAGSQIEATIFTKPGGFKATEFIGYKQHKADAKIIEILKDGKRQETAHTGELVDIVLGKAVFYGEAGGQVGDTGSLETPDAKAEVIDTKRIDNSIILKAKILKGKFKINEIVNTAVDYERRLAIARNHTATHLLQSALRQVLGKHVQQQGSLVAPEKLRFDFAHFKDVTDQQLERIEQIVNEKIVKDDPLLTECLSIKEAKEKGALAFFKDKYEDTVRMVSVGDYSKELCGGTHVDHIGQIGIFKIVSESSIASGIRRIEAITGDSALKKIKEDQAVLVQIANTLGVKKVGELPSEIEKLLNKIDRLYKLLKSQRRKIFQMQIDEILKKSQEHKSIKIIIHHQDGLSEAEDLREFVDFIKTKVKSAVVILVSWDGQKSTAVVSATEDLVKKGLDAASLAKKLASLAGAGGGGRPNLAQIGSKDKKLVDVVLKEGLNVVKEVLFR